MQASSRGKKSHFYLAAGKVVFQDPSQDNQMGAIELNVLLSCKEQAVPARQLGRAQQSLQIKMFERFEDPNLKIIDVFVYAISYLGHMTEEEFSRPAEAVAPPPSVPSVFN
jgi:hypothetical protein